MPIAVSVESEECGIRVPRRPAYRLGMTNGIDIKANGIIKSGQFVGSRQVDDQRLVTDARGRLCSVATVLEAASWTGVRNRGWRRRGLGRRHPFVGHRPTFVCLNGPAVEIAMGVNPVGV